MTGWLQDRIGWASLRAALAAHRAPQRSFVFYLGGVTMFLLLVQIASGLLLVLHYQPDAAQAYGSVDRISGEVPYGDLIRGVHVWAGDMFVACLLAHAFTVVLRRSFRPPRELSWLSGVAALVIGVGMAFTGALLPWSEAAYTNARVGSELAGDVPFVGHVLRGFLRGGEEVGPATLRHAFGFHVAVLPAALTLVVGLHLFFLARKPATVAEEKPAAGGSIPLYPDFLTRQAVALTTVLVAIMSLAIFLQRPLGDAADPRVSPAAPHPPWYFLPVHEIVRAAPRELLGVDGARFLMGAACVVGVLFAALPFLDRRGSKVTAWIAWALLLSLVLLSTRAIH
jgi:quinol-cytochrome oxidoreductase complex cytochrome b subunit